MQTGLSVTDNDYVEAVAATFSNNCGYCNCALEADRAAIEHPDGMNRLRIGLHVPGNVIIACKRCNNEKRRDDSRQILDLAETGWESFLTHDSTRCSDACKTCAYWRLVWINPAERIANLKTSRQRLLDFRRNYSATLDWSERARVELRDSVEKLYRDCQDFAIREIQTLVDSLFARVTT